MKYIQAFLLAFALMLTATGARAETGSIVNSSVATLGIQGSTLYFRLTDPAKMPASCSYGVIYTDTTPLYGQAVWQSLLQALVQGSLIARLDYYTTTGSNNESICRISGISVSN